MRREDMRVGVLVIEGTNSEDETAAAFRALGTQAEIIHLKQLTGDDVHADERRMLDDYHGLVFAGGFSGGDYIRAGAIMASRMKSRLFDPLKTYVKAGHPVLGICNGFQILVELGMLPDTNGVGLSASPEAVLYLNDSDRYECRPTRLKHVNKGTCGITKDIPLNDIRVIPSAHGEGRLLMDPADPAKTVRVLQENDQVVFTYTDADGNDDVPYPFNPNGAPGGIAGITNRDGNVLGLMPHPERSFYRWNHPDWTRTGGIPKTAAGTAAQTTGAAANTVQVAAPDATQATASAYHGDGHAIMEGFVRYAERNL